LGEALAAAMGEVGGLRAACCGRTASAQERGGAGLLRCGLDGVAQAC
jgi:alanine dehydrogenase